MSNDAESNQDSQQETSQPQTESETVETSDSDNLIEPSRPQQRSFSSPQDDRTSEQGTRDRN